MSLVPLLAQAANMAFSVGHGKRNAIGADHFQLARSGRLGTWVRPRLREGV